MEWKYFEGREGKAIKIEVWRTKVSTMSVEVKRHTTTNAWATFMFINNGDMVCFGKHKSPEEVMAYVEASQDILKAIVNLNVMTNELLDTFQKNAKS